jgi:hypothetical protein
VGTALAAQTAASAHGPWRLANSPALAVALPNAYFDSLGNSQIDGPLRALPAEPPYTCPVRTVAWEGGSREASPYPDPTPILRDSAELRSVRGTAEVAP